MVKVFMELTARKSGLTQAEFVNKLLADAIIQNREKIDNYREITKK